MTIPNLNRETALRIALAARVIPDVGVGKLLEILHRRIDGELNEETLKHITVTDLKTGFASADGEEDGEDIGIGLPAMKEAVRILWGEAEMESLPEPVPLTHIPAGSVRVAVASNSGEKLDGHFGSCLRFLVYQVSGETIQLVDVRSALEADLAEDRNQYRADLIRDCQVMYVVSIGGPAAAKVVKAGIYPMKMNEGCPAREALEKLQSVMKASPPPWLAKILGVSAEDRVRFERSEASA